MGSGLISQIFPTPDTATTTGLSTSVAESRGAMGDQDGFIRLCGEPKAGSTSAIDWIEEIKKVWAHGPASTLELARLICVIRKQLPRGQWTALWRSDEMPFGLRTGYHFRVIGEGLGWANVHMCARLPAGCRILYHLARLDRKTLERLIKEKAIRPTLTEREPSNWSLNFVETQSRHDQSEPFSGNACAGSPSILPPIWPT